VYFVVQESFLSLIPSLSVVLFGFFRGGLDMENRQKVILRFLDGKRLKGYITNVTIADDYVFIEEEGSPNSEKVRVKDLKAIFFVKNFEGNKQYRERKALIDTDDSRKKVSVRFKDGESITGCIDNDTPWEKGFFLESQKGNGFFLIPADSDSNNIRIFVITGAVNDVTMIGG
jgi:hypothetical protein